MPFIGAKDLHLGLQMRGERQRQEKPMQILCPKSELCRNSFGNSLSGNELHIELGGLFF